ncbi:MAG: hypothetical protein ABR503_13760, partial [Chitinophagaceae bacterium]
MKLFAGIFVTLGLIVMMGCSKKTPPEVVEVGQTYYFYPKANVYFDTTVGNYIFQGPDGGWHTNAKLPAEKQSLLEKNIIINNPELPVWKNNDAHQLLYSAALYSTSADFKEKEKIAVNKKDAVTAENKEDSKDNKTGLGKFFNKIFKGKKERQEKENGKP